MNLGEAIIILNSENSGWIKVMCISTIIIVLLYPAVIKNYRDTLAAMKETKEFNK